MKRSKLYNSRLEKVDINKAYGMKEAFETLKSLPAVKFDAIPVQCVRTPADGVPISGFVRLGDVKVLLVNV